MTFIPPKGVLRLLRFRIDWSSSSWSMEGPRLTVEERIMREGRLFCSVAALRDGCHDGVALLKIVRASQKGHSEDGRRSIAVPVDECDHLGYFPKSSYAALG